MINEELYNLLNAINKEYKYIGYDKDFKNNKMLILSGERLILNSFGYFENLWECNYAVVLTHMFPCLCLLIEGESKLYNIDLLIQEYEVLREVLDDDGNIRTKVN